MIKSRIKRNRIRVEKKREKLKLIKKFLEGGCQRVMLNEYLDGRENRTGCEEGEVKYQGYRGGKEIKETKEMEEMKKTEEGVEEEIGEKVKKEREEKMEKRVKKNKKKIKEF